MKSIILEAIRQTAPILAFLALVSIAAMIYSCHLLP